LRFGHRAAVKVQIRRQCIAVYIRLRGNRHRRRLYVGPARFFFGAGHGLGASNGTLTLTPDIVVPHPLFDLFAMFFLLCFFVGPAGFALLLLFGQLAQVRLAIFVNPRHNPIN
jgi:hypothetical protein